MDILQLIKEEHAEINSILPRLKDDEIDLKWHQLYEKASALVLAHLQVEERYLFPEIEELFPSAVDFVNLAADNHKAMREVLAQIDKGLAQKKPSIDQILEWISELDELVTKHLQMEEEIVMPKLRRMIPTSEREEMGEVWKDTRDEILSSRTTPAKSGNQGVRLAASAD